VRKGKENGDHRFAYFDVEIRWVIRFSAGQDIEFPKIKGCPRAHLDGQRRRCTAEDRLESLTDTPCGNQAQLQKEWNRLNRSVESVRIELQACTFQDRDYYTRQSRVSRVCRNMNVDFTVSYLRNFADKVEGSANRWFQFWMWMNPTYVWQGFCGRNAGTATIPIESESISPGSAQSRRAAAWTKFQLHRFHLVDRKSYKNRRLIAHISQDPKGRKDHSQEKVNQNDASTKTSFLPLVSLGTMP
jgi:hypothetical protein